MPIRLFVRANNIFNQTYYENGFAYRRTHRAGRFAIRVLSHYGLSKNETRLSDPDFRAVRRGRRRYPAADRVAVARPH